jgi:hypothetical protein
LIRPSAMHEGETTNAGLFGDLRSVGSAGVQRSVRQGAGEAP